MQRLQLFDDVQQVNAGFLWSPAQQDLIDALTPTEVIHGDSLVMDWPPYTAFDCSVYPLFLSKLTNIGIAFVWEYEATEDFIYYAYNFPTEDNPSNFGHFKTGDKRKKVPFLSKKKRAEVESYSAAQELLYHLGIKNGSN